MEYDYKNQSPNWSAEGVEPPDELKTSGFQIGYKPPAEYFNWFWKTVSACIEELQTNSAGMDVSGMVYEIDGESVVAGNGAEVFNRALNIATGTASHAEGYNTSATGNHSHAEGLNTFATHDSTHAEGYGTSAIGNYSHAEGKGTTASGQASHAQGFETTADGMAAFSGGYTSSASGDYAYAFGDHVTAESGNYVIGKLNKSTTATGSNVNTGDLFVIGSGLAGGAKSNALRVTASGQVLGTQAYTSTGADICHIIEWADGNPNNEDRRGLFVTLDGDKIRLATADDDYILGVISATPSLICNACTDDWYGKYVTDEYGARVLENGAFKLSNGFDETLDENYTSRLERPEWGIVGHCGMVIVRDDGTCEVNSYCLPNNNGEATKAETGYRVMKRISENRIQIFVSAPIIITK